MDLAYPAVRWYVMNYVTFMYTVRMPELVEKITFRRIDLDGIYGRRIAYAELPAPVNFAHFSDYCAKCLYEYIWQLRTRPSKSQ